MEKDKFIIRYLPSFDEEFEEIIIYIAYKLKNKNAAEKLIENVNQAIINRSKNPKNFEAYKSKRKRKYTWYRIYIKNFTIFYTVTNNMMEVAHILYNKRNIEELI